MKKILTIIGLTFAIMCTVAPAVSALGLPTELHPDYAPVIQLEKNPQGKEPNEADYANFFLQLIAGGLLYFAGPVAILVIAVAGLRYTTAAGKQENLDGAKKTLMWAIIGLIMIILAFAAVRIVITTILQTPTQQQNVTKMDAKSSPAGSTGAGSGSTGNTGGTAAETSKKDSNTPVDSGGTGGKAVGGRGPGA